MDRREQEIWREALRATSLGWDLALPIFGGVLMGYVLDRSLHTGYVLTLGFLLFGIATGFYNMIRSIQRLDRCSRQQNDGTMEQREKEDGAAL